eukprot:7020159-Alexandrium_andersonii.AAC.1
MGWGLPRDAQNGCAEREADRYSRLRHSKSAGANVLTSSCGEQWTPALGCVDKPQPSDADATCLAQ